MIEQLKCGFYTSKQWWIACSECKVVDGFSRKESNILDENAMYSKVFIPIRKKYVCHCSCYSFNIQIKRDLLGTHNQFSPIGVHTSKLIWNIIFIERMQPNYHNGRPIKSKFLMFWDLNQICSDWNKFQKYNKTKSISLYCWPQPVGLLRWDIFIKVTKKI